FRLYRRSRNSGPPDATTPATPRGPPVHSRTPVVFWGRIQERTALRNSIYVANSLSGVPRIPVFIYPWILPIGMDLDHLSHSLSLSLSLSLCTSLPPSPPPPPLPSPLSLSLPQSLSLSSSLSLSPSFPHSL